MFFYISLYFIIRSNQPFSILVIFARNAGFYGHFPKKSRVFYCIFLHCLYLFVLCSPAQNYPVIASQSADWCGNPPVKRAIVPFCFAKVRTILHSKKLIFLIVWNSASLTSVSLCFFCRHTIHNIFCFLDLTFNS